VTKNSSTTSSTLWASRSRSNTTASLRRPRGAASRSGGRGGRPSPGLGVGRLSNSGCGACGTPGGGSGGGAAAAARGLPSIEPLRGRFFFAAFFPVAAATAALASFFADLTREFARRRVGLIGFCGFASLGAAPPGVPLPACSIVWCLSEARAGGRGCPRARRRGRPTRPPVNSCRASSRRAGPRRCGGTRSWPEHGG
jgi:hypothetical protein